MRFPHFFQLLLVGCLCFTCTEAQRNEGRAAEQAYATLYLAIQANDTRGSVLAAKQLEQKIVMLRSTWIDPLGEEDMEEVHFRLDRAFRAFMDVKTAIAIENLPMAAVQLDRATYELNMAHPECFNELYLGQLYPFISSWYSLSEIVKAPDLCGFECSEALHYVVGVQNLWLGKDNTEPSLLTYPKGTVDRTELNELQKGLTVQLDYLVDMFEYQDECLIQQETEIANSIVMQLIELFSNGGAPTSPSLR